MKSNFSGFTSLEKINISNNTNSQKNKITRDLLRCIMEKFNGFALSKNGGRNKVTIFAF